MAYNTKSMLKDINNKLIPQYYDPRTDSFKPFTKDGKENPFQTKIGQDVISISEDFYARLWREGRPLNNYEQGKTLTANILTSGASVYTSPGCEFYPTNINISCDVDAMVMIRYSTKINHAGANNGQFFDVAYAKAGTPFVREPKGIKIPEGGDVVIMALSATVGKLYGSIYGVEVTIDA